MAVLGTNIESVTSWSSGWVFTDQFKKSRRWIAHTETEFDSRQRIDTDANGWPVAVPQGVMPGTLLMDSGAHYPAGIYTLKWRGAGALSILNMNPGQWRQPMPVDESVACVATEFELTFTGKGEGVHVTTLVYAGGTGGCRLMLRQFDAHQPISNIKLFMPGFTAPQPRFHPEWLATLSPYKTLRFMDWLNTNGSAVSRWSERALPTHANVDIAGGVPYEWIIELANISGKDLWLTVPHRADDEYVAALAGLLKAQLQEDRRCYIEYSNEVWNNLFPQADMIQQAGVAGQLDADHYQARIKQYVHRANAIFTIMERDFSADPKRLQKVLAWQAVDGPNQEQLLNCNKPFGKATVFAIAPYFGHELGSDPAVAEWHKDKLLKALAETAVPAALQAARETAGRARAFGLQPACYEFGQHLVPAGPNADNEKVRDLFIAANRDPRMEKIYADYLSALSAAGLAPMLHFNDMGQPTVWGMWGALESMAQAGTGSPKFAALTAFAGGQSNDKPGPA